MKVLGNKFEIVWYCLYFAFFICSFELGNYKLQAKEKTAFDLYMECVEKRRSGELEKSSMTGEIIDQLLRHELSFDNYPFQSKGKWISFRGPTLEVVDSYKSEKYPGGEIYLARNWHQVDRILSDTKSEVFCLDDGHGPVGDIRWVTAFLNGRNAPLDIAGENQSFVDARPFFGFQVCQKGHYYLPNTLYLNAALDKASERLVAKGKFPIRTRFYESDSIENSNLKLLERFATKLEWPRANSGFYFYHDTFFHTLFAFMPGWIYEEIAAYVDYYLKIWRLALETENRKKIFSRYAALGGKNHEDIEDMYKIFLANVAGDLDEVTANVSVALYNYFDHKNYAKLGAEILSTLRKFYEYRKYLNDQRTDRRVSEGAKFAIADRLPRRLKKRGKYAELLMSLAKENGIEPPRKTRLLKYIRKKEQSQLALEILKRRNDILNVSQPF